MSSNATSQNTEGSKKKTKQYRMVALDLDGTLLSSTGTLADTQAEYLRGLYEKGFQVCIATGRSVTKTYSVAAKLRIPRLPIVCSNGSNGYYYSAFVPQPQGTSSITEGPPIMEEQFQFQVPKDIVLRALNLANKHDFCLQYYYKNSIYANHKSDLHYTWTKKYTEITAGVRIQHIDDDYKEMLEQNQLPSKILLLFDAADHKKAQNVTHEEFAPSEASIAFVRGDWAWFLEVLNADCNKGNGLKLMCEKLLKIPLEEVIAVGDGHNDIEFLKMAGLGVAVQNADAAVKEIADVTLDFTNDEYGPMRILQELEEKGELVFQQE